MSLIHELAGPKILEKIKIYILSSAEPNYLCQFEMRYPVEQLEFKLQKNIEI